MKQKPYVYKQIHSKRYFFVSEGKVRIAKVIEFTPLGVEGMMNLCFGDLLPDNSIDDVLRQFTQKNPTIQVYIEGSNGLRKEFFFQCVSLDLRKYKTGGYIIS